MPRGSIFISTIHIKGFLLMKNSRISNNYPFFKFGIHLFTHCNKCIYLKSTYYKYSKSAILQT